MDEKDTVVVAPSTESDEENGTVIASDIASEETEPTEEEKKAAEEAEKARQEQMEKDIAKVREYTNNPGIMTLVEHIISRSGINAADIILKTNVYLKVFGTAMRTLKEKEPKVWNQFLEQAKFNYTSAPDSFSAIVEMLAITTVEFEDSLTESNFSSFTTQLFQYAKINNLLYK